MEGMLEKYIQNIFGNSLNFFPQKFQWFGLPRAADSPSHITNPQELHKSESLS